MERLSSKSTSTSLYGREEVAINSLSWAVCCLIARILAMVGSAHKKLRFLSNLRSLFSSTIIEIYLGTHRNLDVVSVKQWMIFFNLTLGVAGRESLYLLGVSKSSTFRCARFTCRCWWRTCSTRTCHVCYPWSNARWAISAWPWALSFWGEFMQEDLKLLCKSWEGYVAICTNIWFDIKKIWLQRI